MVNFPTLLCFTLLATAAAREVAKDGCIIIAQAHCCKYKDGRAGYTGEEHGDCVPAAHGKTFKTGRKCEPTCVANGGTCGPENTDYVAEEAELVGTCAAPTEAPATTTITPWDSSASSSAGSDSLASIYSSSFKEESSNTFDSSSETSVESYGSQQSGSSGSFMFIWQWLLLACCCGAAVVAPLLKPKPKKKVPKKPVGPAKTTLASDHPAGCTYLEVASQQGFKAGQTIEIGAGTPTAEIHNVSGLGSILLTAPLMYPHPAGTEVLELKDPKVPAQVPVQPIATTSTVIPSYTAMAPTYAAPMATYAAPTTTAFAAAPISYAAPAAYAAPATTSYAGSVV